MTVEVKVVGGLYYLIDEQGLEYPTTVYDTTKLKQVDTRDKVKTLLKLKEEGFTPKDIIELKQEGLL